MEGCKIIHKLHNDGKILKVTPFRKPDMKKAPVKASIANKYIGYGVAGSSTAAYAEEIARNGGLVNVAKYSTDDIVFVSINGNRLGAERMQEITIELACEALLQGAVLITDDEYNRNRNYNSGERKLAKALQDIGASYKEQTIDDVTIGVWALNKHHLNNMIDKK